MTIANESPALLAPAEPRHRVPTLDGLRGLAILMVMVFHMSVLGFLDPPDRSIVDRAWLSVAMFGWSGVDLFFVLSGFLITGILLDAKGGDRGRYFGSFYARRALRIAPLYYAVVAFALLVLPHLHTAKSDRFGSIRGDEVWYWTFLSNWVIGYRAAFRHGILDVTWSLAIEEQFYLVWPAVVLLVSRQTLGRICVGLIGLSIASRAGLYVFGSSPAAMHIPILTLTPCRMDGLAAGAIVALLARRPGGLAAVRPVARRVAAGLGAALIAVLVCQGTNWTGSWPCEWFSYTAVAVFDAAVLVLVATADAGGWVSRLFDSAPLRHLGRFSFALYLFHNPIRGVIRDRVYRPDQFLAIAGSRLPGQLIFYAIAMSLSLAAAWASWHLLEKRVLRWKRFVPMPAVDLHQGSRPT